MRKLTLLILLAAAGLALASACGGASTPPGRLAFYFDRFGNSDISIPDDRISGRSYLTSSLPWAGFPI